MLAGILLTIQILVSLAMGGLILIQRSEGGALGMGGGPSGLVSARGAGNILTRATMILAVIFFANSVGLTVVSNLAKKSQSAINKVDTTKITQAPVTTAPQQAAQAESEATPAKPSLSDLPLAVVPSAVPAPTVSASSSSAMSSKPAAPQAKSASASSSSAAQ
jgi:preprotein translocase subunit SecG